MQVVGTCGALTGGIIALDYFFGRPVENLSDKERIEANINALTSARKISTLLANKFWTEYGTIICAQIQRQLFGRYYYLDDPDEYQKMSQAEADSAPRNCSHVVGNATRWVMKILLDKGAVEL